MELLERYQKAIDDLLLKVRTTQKDAIVKAGQMVADCVANGGNVYLTQIVHGVEGDVIFRGGGPAFYRRFSYNLNISEDGRKRDKSDLGIETEGLDARYLLAKSGIRPGDILFVSSVSGRTLPVVELAYEAEKFGVKVIAFSSMEYARSVEPVHSSGKKLYEFVSLVLDNCAPPAEAMLEVEGIEARYAAASGISSDYILWCLTSVAIEELMKKGITPGIYKSANFPGGNDYNHSVVIPNYEKYGW